VAIALAGGITLLAIMSGRTDWHIDLSNATPIEILIAILGITCAISGLLSGVFIIIFVVKTMKG
jgi:hypothetical protein